jgi:hypothetical protein
MEDYVQRFSALVDAISAYETHPDPLHYLTRNLDGLKPAVRVLVAIQQPADLDAAFTMALLYEELGEGMDSIVSRPYSSSSSRRSSLQFSPVHHPPAQPRHHLLNGFPGQLRRSVSWTTTRIAQRINGLASGLTANPRVYVSSVGKGGKRIMCARTLFSFMLFGRCSTVLSHRKLSTILTVKRIAQQRHQLSSYSYLRLLTVLQFLVLDL